MIYNYSFSAGVTLRGRRGVQMMNSEEKLELERRMKNPIAPGYRYSEDYYRKYHASDPEINRLIAEGHQILNPIFDRIIPLTDPIPAVSRLVQRTAPE